MARQHLPKRSTPIGEPPRGFDGSQAAGAIVQRALRAGFALAGIAPAAESLRKDALLAWLARGEHGSMEYMERDLGLRLDPRGLLKGTRAFLVVADQYATRNDPPDESRFGTGRVARYARGRNYHDVMKRRLHALADELRAEYPYAEFRTCVDTAPVPERELGVLAGLGWQGKNTMLIHPRIGSWIVLGVVATTLPLRPAPESLRVPDSCGTCTRCIDACPTGAITPYRVDARRCISYLTIERREAIDPSLGSRVGEWLAGCDICQEVCPHNSARRHDDVGSAHASYTPVRSGFDLFDVLGWNESDRRRALENSALKRITLDMFRRNAVLVAAHWLRAKPAHPHAAALRERLAQLARDPAEPASLRDLAESALRECPSDAR